MNNKRNHTRKAAVISGTLVTGLVAGLAANDVNANELFEYSDMGSGYELRNDLINLNMVEQALATNTVRAKVWEDKCDEGKCDEGKCGEEKKKEEKKEVKKEVKEGTNENALKSETEKKAEEEKKAKEEKTKEAKCGEGKCGM